MMSELFTIGHSTQTREQFLELPAWQVCDRRGGRIACYDYREPAAEH